MPAHVLPGVAHRAPHHGMRAVGPRGGEAAVPAPSQGWHGDSSGDRRLGQQEPLTGVWCRTGGPGLSGAALSVLWRWGGGGLAAVVGGSTLPGHIVRGPWGSPCPGLLCLPCLPSPPSRAGPRVRRWHRRGRGAAQCRDSSPGSSGFEVMGGGVGGRIFLVAVSKVAVSRKPLPGREPCHGWRCPGPAVSHRWLPWQ